MANKFVLVPQEIYRGLTSVPDTGVINLDAVRHDLDRARGERTNPSTKNVHYNQQLRRYLQMRRELADRPAKVELTKGLSVLLKRDGGVDDEDEVVDTQPRPPAPPPPPPPPASKHHRRPPSPPDHSSSDDSQPPRPPRPMRPQRTKKNHHSSLKHGRLNEWKQRHRDLQQPVVRDLLAEAAAAPLPESDDDDEQMLESGHLLPAPSQYYGDIPMLPDYADEIEEMDTAQQRLASRRKIKGEQGLDKNKKYKIYYSPPPSPKREQTRRRQLLLLPSAHKRPDHPPPPPPPRSLPKVELKRDPQPPKLRKVDSPPPPQPPPHRAKREPKIEFAPHPPPRNVSKREPKVELAPPPLPPRHFPKREPKLEVEPQPSTSKQAGYFPPPKIKTGPKHELQPTNRPVPYRIPKKEQKIEEKPSQQQQQPPPPAVVVEEMPYVPPSRRGTKRTHPVNDDDNEVHIRKRVRQPRRVRVQYSPEPGPSTSAQTDEQQQQQRELFATPSNQLTMTQRIERLYFKCNHYADRMGVRGNTINTANGKPLAHSNLRMSIKYIIDRRAGRPTIKPPGAGLLEERLRQDPILYSWTAPPKRPSQSKTTRTARAIKKEFRPKKWS